MAWQWGWQWLLLPLILILLIVWRKRPAAYPEGPVRDRVRQHWWDLAMALLTGAVISGALFVIEDGREEERLQRAIKSELHANLIIQPDLIDFRLSGQDLQGLNLLGKDLTSATLEEADLREAILARTTLENVGARDIDLRGTFLMEATVRNTSLVGADLRGAFLNQSSFDRVDLRKADLRGVDVGTGFKQFEFICWDEDTEWPSEWRPKGVTCSNWPSASAASATLPAVRNGE